MVDLATTLIGTYSLISYIAYPLASPSEKSYPYGNATGQIIYSPSGHMSAVLVRPGQAPFDDGAGMLPLTSGTPKDWETVGRNMVAYAGRFWVDEPSQTVIHEVANVWLPGAKGSHAPRKVTFSEEGKKMVLSIDKTVISGVESAVEVRWERMPSNNYLTYPGKGNV